VSQTSIPSLTTSQEFLIEDCNDLSVPGEPLFTSQLVASIPENTAASFWYLKVGIVFHDGTPWKRTGINAHTVRILSVGKCVNGDLFPYMSKLPDLDNGQRVPGLGMSEDRLVPQSMH
jgi:hypothetical protein